MSFAGAFTNWIRVIKLWEEELKNAISATENFVTNSDDIRNNLTEYTQQATVQALIDGVLNRRGNHSVMQAQARTMLIASAIDLAEEINSGSLVDGAIIDEAQFFEDLSEHMENVTDERVTFRAVALAADPADSDTGLFRRLTVDHRNQVIESGFHNQTKTFRITANGASGAGQGQAIGELFGTDGGEDSLDYQKGSGRGERSVSDFRATNERNPGKIRNSQLFVSGATTDGTPVTAATLGSWTLTDVLGTPTKVVRATGSAAVWRSKEFGIAVSGQTTTWKFAQDLINITDDPLTPLLPMVVVFFDSTWTGTITIEHGGSTQAFTEASLSAGFNFLFMDRDSDLYPVNFATGSEVFSVQIATTSAAGELVFQMVDTTEGVLYENHWFFQYSSTNEPTVWAEVQWADTNTFAGVIQDTLAWAFEEEPFAYLPTVGTNLIADPA